MNLTSFYLQNRELIFFTYGLVYVLTGFGILVKNVGASQFKLAKFIRLFAWFAIFHGLADWAPAFLPLNERNLTPEVYNLLRFAVFAMLSVSYVYLFVFGLKVVLARNNWRTLLPVVIFVAWLLAILAVRPLAADFDQWLACVEALSRYFLGFPAAVMAAYAFFKQTKDFKQLDMPRLTNHMWWGAFFIAVYSVFTGLVVSKAPFFPASIINYNSFIAVTGIPVQLFRFAIGIGIGVNIIKSLELFDVEQKKRVEEAERREAILQERGRISREIHDGTIQSLYGIGLTLEQCRRLLADNPGHPARELLDYSVKKLNDTIKDIRSYIMDLQQLYFQDTKLRQSLLELVNEFALTSQTKPDFDYQEYGAVSLTPKQRSHIYHIIKEALNNVRRHADAQHVTLKVHLGKNAIDVAIVDDGRGFDKKKVAEYDGEHRGINNMTERVEALNGKMKITTAPGKGTGIFITIPYGGAANGENQAGRCR